MSDCLFYVFAAMTLFSALFAVAGKNPVNGAMGMILALVGVAANFFLLDAPFLGVLQIMVYAGAVMVLFLFIIMLLDADAAGARKFDWKKFVLGACVLAVAGGVMFWLVNLSGGLPATAAPEITATPAAENPAAFASGAKSFGYLLFTKYMLPLQIAGFLLLIAMIGVVALSRKHEEK